MSIREESNSSQPKIRRAFNIEEVHDLRRGNSIHQLQTAVKSLSNEIRRPCRAYEDDLRDMRIDPPKFDRILNPDHYLKWIQA